MENEDSMPYLSDLKSQGRNFQDASIIKLAFNNYYLLLSALQLMHMKRK